MVDQRLGNHQILLRRFPERSIQAVAGAEGDIRTFGYEMKKPSSQVKGKAAQIARLISAM